MQRSANEICETVIKVLGFCYLPGSFSVFVYAKLLKQCEFQLDNRAIAWAWTTPSMDHNSCWDHINDFLQISRLCANTS